MEVWQWVLVVCGGVTTIGGAIAVISKWIKPLADYSKRLMEVERHDKTDMARFDAIDRRFHLQELENQAIMKALFAMTEHALSGNGVDKLKKARDELTKYIIEKGTNHELENQI